MSYPILLLVGSLVTWRVTRFWILDSMFGGTRDRLKAFLDSPRTGWRNVASDKAWDLVTCPFCVSIWVSLGFCLLTRWLAVDSIPMPVWTWLAIAAGSLIPYQILDGDWIVTIGKKEH